MSSDIEGAKLTADYVKWLTSISTLVIGGGGITLGPKVDGLHLYLYVGAIILSLLSIVAGAFALINLAIYVKDHESPDPDHTLANWIGWTLITQMICFLLSLGCFSAVLVGMAINGGFK